MRCIVPYCLPSRATTSRSTLNVAKVQYKLRVDSGLNLPWYGRMECTVWTYGIWKKNLVWNGRFLVWNGNGMKENCQCGIWKNRLPYHTIPCPADQDKSAIKL